MVFVSPSRQGLGLDREVISSSRLLTGFGVVCMGYDRACHTFMFQELLFV